MKYISLLSFFISAFILSITYSQAQTPPDRTFYYNNAGQKTTINERWLEDNSGLKNGIYIKYFQNGEREILGNYTHGKKSGKWEFFNVNSFGNITSKTIYNYSNDLKNGEYQHINYNDNSIEKGFYTNDLKTANWRENHKVINNKIIYQEGGYLNDTRNGEWKNVNVRAYSKDEIYNYGYLLKNRDGYFQDKNNKEYELETIEGYRTVFLNGNIQACYSPNGINVFEQLLKAEALEQKQKEDAYNLKQQQEKENSDFKIAMGKYYDETAKKYYGDTTDIHTFLLKYPNGTPSHINQAKQCVRNKNDNDAFYRIKSIEEFFDYEKKFPNGIHINEVQKYLKDYTLSNEKTLRDDVIKYLNEANIDDVMIGCKLLLRYRDQFNETHNQLTVIYYSLALWARNDTKAIEVVKPYMNSVIHFSNADVKFKNRFWEYYKTYKNSLKLDNKEIYTSIKAL